MYSDPRLVVLGKAVTLIQHGPHGEKATVPGDGAGTCSENCAAAEIDD